MHCRTNASEIHLRKIRDSTLTSLEFFQIYLTANIYRVYFYYLSQKEQNFVTHCLYLHLGSLKIDIQNGARIF